MDTIETSNLNRQFLFRQRHVGQSKAKVAADAVKRFRPAANITAHQVLRWVCRAIVQTLVSASGESVSYQQSQLCRRPMLSELGC